MFKCFMGNGHTIIESWSNIFEVWDESDDLPLILLRNIDDNSEPNTNEETSIQAFQSMFAQLDNSNLNECEIRAWIHDDHPHSDNDQFEENSEDSDIEPESPTVQHITHQECLTAVETCIKWAELNSELLDSKFLRNFAEKVIEKKLNSHKQTTLKDYLTPSSV